MKRLAIALAVSAFALTACTDQAEQPVPVNPDHPGDNPDCKYETQAGDCVPVAD
jgi:hypothetical protein